MQTTRDEDLFSGHCAWWRQVVGGHITTIIRNLVVGMVWYSIERKERRSEAGTSKEGKMKRKTPEKLNETGMDGLIDLFINVGSGFL